LISIAHRVWENATREGFRGSDPYDGLNSRLLRPVVSGSRFLRLLTIQAVKRSPVDLRRALLVPKGLNPKGLALFLTGISEYPVFEKWPEHKTWLEDALLSTASLPDGAPAFGSRTHRRGLAEEVSIGRIAVPGAIGWGYDFPWQARAFLQPAFYPTAVATSFVVDSFLWSRSPCYGPVVEAAATFVGEHLHRHESDDGICFSYSPRDRTRVYNASLFAAKILALAVAGNEARRDERRQMAIQAADYVVSRQRPDGAWVYGDADHWGWVDNVHTGFVLETLGELSRLLDTDRWNDAVRHGLKYYRERLFMDDGTSCFNDQDLYPLDPHSSAQAALTFLRLSESIEDGTGFVRAILDRCVDHLWDARRGGFSFQKRRLYTIRTIHMRWSQAWMFRALCAHLASHDTDHSLDS
jgi:hypothetical protein